jgi:hypothetical protein
VRGGVVVGEALRELDRCAKLIADLGSLIGEERADPPVIDVG